MPEITTRLPVGRAHMFFANETEGCEIAPILTMKGGAHFLAGSLNLQNGIVVTHGWEGATWHNRNAPLTVSPNIRSTLPLTTGCGDLLMAYTSLGFIVTKDRLHALRLGVAAGTLRAKRLLHEPTIQLQDIEHFAFTGCSVT